ncbi:NADH-quinone oxidoreductase subunit M [Mycolicibacterium elephantis]|uniref:NADH-quinone oxidoreductase subunit M n=1 Tax=Mycolicibacterium elephantis TaxID=81858 RepID=UPI0007EBE855|nr:NADH-quinone oxidoreductase subunit M [Mycolicibacterium elephantis]OBA85466.1 NADH-quinone oxidoreductase subunit M [Mycolicibacterium elephantis]
MMSQFPWLSVLWVVPVVGAGFVMTLPRHARDLAKWVGVAVSVATVAVAALVTAQFQTSGDRYQFVESHSWIPSFGVGYIVGVDGIALVLIILTVVVVPVVLLAGWHDGANEGRSTHAYVALTLLLEGMVLISLMALDVLLFFMFFEVMLVPLYFLIGVFGGERRGKAALKFLLYNLFGGLIMLAAVIVLYVATLTNGLGSETAGTFDLRTIAAAVANGELLVNPAVLNMVFLGFMLAFAIKAPLWPFHSWLPDAAVEATPATAVLMMAVVDKVGTFGMLRYCLQLFPQPSTYFRPAIIALAVTAIIYGAIVAIGQTDVMRLIAYTSISHFGFIVMGIFVMTSEGQSGSTLYMVNHGIATAALFLIAGFLVSRRGTRAIAAYGGVQKVAPALAGTFLVAGMATLALPGLAPFISEFLVLVGTFTRYPIFAVLASVALVLSAVYILWLYQRMMTGPVTDGNEKLRDLVPREIAVVSPLIALLIVLGFYPKPALDLINPAVAHTLTSIGQQDPQPTVPTAAEGSDP